MLMSRVLFTEEAAQSAKESAGLNSGEAQGKAKELAGEAKGMTVPTENSDFDAVPLRLSMYDMNNKC